MAGTGVIYQARALCLGGSGTRSGKWGARDVSRGTGKKIKAVVHRIFFWVAYTESAHIACGMRMFAVGTKRVLVLPERATVNNVNCGQFLHEIQEKLVSFVSQFNNIKNFRI